MVTSASTEPRQLLAQRRRAIDATLAGVVPAGTRVGLLSFPNHRNAGDTAIWLGARAALDRIDVEVAYTCTPDTFDARAARRRVGSGPLLLNGGGNLGDLYRGQQSLRERVLATCRDQPIVQLPQSIHFRSPAERDRVARLIEGHGAVTLLCREEASLALATEHLGAATTAFCHDLALSLPPRPRPVAPTVDVVWLARRDPESVHGAPTEAQLAPLAGRSVRVVDWLEPLPGEAAWPDGAERAYRANQVLVARMRRSPALANRGWRLLDATFAPLATAWVRRGVHLLSRGRIVVTDRLHAHVLALLHDVPSVVLDNSYGKVHGVVAASTAGASLTHPVASVEEAVATAATLLAGTAPLEGPP